MEPYEGRDRTVVCRETRASKAGKVGGEHLDGRRELVKAVGHAIVLRLEAARFLRASVTT